MSAVGLGGFLKKVGKAVGKGLGAVEKATRPVHGIARSVASGAANAVAPGSGQLVHAFTGGNRAATAGGVGTMLPELSRVTGINVATGKAFDFAGLARSIASQYQAGPITIKDPFDQLGPAGNAVRAVMKGSRGVQGGSPEAVEKYGSRSQVNRRQTVGYQGDAPPLMSSHRAGAQVYQLPNGQVRRKYRRMNVANTRALTRSIRRVKGFEKLARRVVNMNVGKRFKKKRGRR